jgi:hypothetical protein
LVYVASNKLLTILKDGGTVAPPPNQPVASLTSTFAISGTSTFAISGTLEGVNTGVLTLKNRNGKPRPIDLTQVQTNGHIAAALTPHEAYTAIGSSFTSSGALLADAIYRAKCRRHNNADGTVSECTGEQWPSDKDPQQ